MRVLYSEPALDKVADLLCLVRADVVITHSPDDYHPDHEATSKLVRTATFAAPIPNFQFARAKHPPLDRIPHVFYCDPLEGKDIFGREIAPLFCVDISGQIDVKEKMLVSHASQRDWLMKHHGMDQYLQAMRDWGAHRGRSRGVAYAEGFRQHLGHSYPQDNLLGTLLGAL